MASSTNEVYFVVDGEVVGKARPRFSRKTGRTYTPSKTVKYEELVRVAYLTEYDEKVPLWGKDEPLEMVVNAYFEIPKSASNKKRLEMLLKGRPTKKPDGDNILKAIADALNGVIYYDDSQIVSSTVRKFWSEKPRAEIIIRGATNEENIRQQYR